jgi:hypothetical protein
VPDPLSPVDLLRIAQTDATSYAEGSEGTKALLALLLNAQEDLEERLAQRFATQFARQKTTAEEQQEDTFTNAQMEVTMEQLLHVTKHLVKHLKGHFRKRAMRAARKAGPATLEYLEAAEKKFTGITQQLAIDEAMMLDAAVAGQDATIMRRLMTTHPDGKGGGILQRYGFEVVNKFERELRVGVITRKPFAKVMDSLIEESPFLKSHPRTWAERIVRTETLGAYNRGAHQAMRKANDVLGDMVRILVATFDNRTGADSYNVHGEIRRMTEPFEYVNYLGEHEMFMMPPNRPNDREVIVAHRLSWPIPRSFRPRSTIAVQSAYQRQKLKYHGRPHVMSTVTVKVPRPSPTG